MPVDCYGPVKKIFELGIVSGKVSDKETAEKWRDGAHVWNERRGLHFQGLQLRKLIEHGHIYIDPKHTK